MATIWRPHVHQTNRDRDRSPPPSLLSPPRVPSSHPVPSRPIPSSPSPFSLFPRSRCPVPAPRSAASPSPPSSPASSAGPPTPAPPPLPLLRPVLLGVTATVIATFAGLYMTTGSLAGVASLLTTSGFSAALALIFFSEIGDKTFFIAALLAMEFGRLRAFTGSMLALGLMTIISVSIGVAFRNVPDALRTSVPVVEWVSVAMLVYFGLQTLWPVLSDLLPDLARFNKMKKKSTDQPSDGEAATSSTAAETPVVKVRIITTRSRPT